MAQDVSFECDGIAFEAIRKGRYFRCPLLTAELNSLYAAIRERLNQAQ